MSKNISHLRTEMFEAISLLKEGKLSVEQAKAISDIGKVVIDSAKVEVDYIKANEGGELPFLDAVGNNNLPPGVVGRTVHRIK